MASGGYSALVMAQVNVPSAAIVDGVVDPAAGSEAGETAVAKTAGAAADAQVNPAGSHKPGVMRWGYFLLLNAIAGAIAVALFIGVLYADSLDPYMQGTYDWLLAHPGVTSVMAFSPLACSLLVGYGYASRARRRKKAAAKRAELLEAARAARQTAAAVS